jgi:hypothetical protein
MVFVLAFNFDGLTSTPCLSVNTHKTWFTVPGTDTSSDCLLGIGALLFFHVIHTELTISQYPFMSDQSSHLPCT